MFYPSINNLFLFHIKKLASILLVCVLTACGGQNTAPLGQYPEPAQETDISTDTILFAQSHQVLLQSGKPKLKALIYNGTVIIYGPEPDNLSQLREKLNQSLKAKKVIWQLEQKTNTPLSFRKKTIVLTQAEERLSRIPEVNLLNYRIAVSDRGKLLIIGQSGNRPEKAKILATLKQIPHINEIAEFIDTNPKLL